MNPDNFRPLRPASETRGFTLIELLTVIAIIGILAAILIPVASQVRKSARATADLSNLRQLGMGMTLYAADNKGAINVVAVFGSGDAWGRNYWTRSAPYLSSMLSGSNFGTATVQTLTQNFKNQTLPSQYLGSYTGIAESLTFATNKRLYPQAPTGVAENNFRKLQQYPNPVKTPYIAVGKWGFTQGVPSELPATVPSEGLFWPYAGMKTIVVYLDGHAAYRGTEITTAECFGDGPTT